MFLGLDSASSACSAAVLSPDGVRAHRFEAMQRGQAEALAPMIRDVLADAGTAPADLAAIAVTVGPGAFTGVRIGLSAARAFALTVSIPVVGVTTFAAVAEPLLGAGGRDILAVIESRRADFFVQMIAPVGNELGPPAALETADVGDYVARHGSGGPIVVAGDGAARLVSSGALSGVEHETAAGRGLPDAADVARIAMRIAVEHGLPDRHVRPSPLYLRPPDVKLPKPA